jgi:hypothetical protein
MYSAMLVSVFQRCQSFWNGENVAAGECGWVVPIATMRHVARDVVGGFSSGDIQLRQIVSRM